MANICIRPKNIWYENDDMQKGLDGGINCKLFMRYCNLFCHLDYYSVQWLEWIKVNLKGTIHSKIYMSSFIILISVQTWMTFIRLKNTKGILKNAGHYTETQVWNEMRMSKWWPGFLVWVNCLFKWADGPERQRIWPSLYTLNQAVEWTLPTVWLHSQHDDEFSEGFRISVIRSGGWTWTLRRNKRETMQSESNSCF